MCFRRLQTGSIIYFTNLCIMTLRKFQWVSESFVQGSRTLEDTVQTLTRLRTFLLCLSLSLVYSLKVLISGNTPGHELSSQSLSLNHKLHLQTVKTSTNSHTLKTELIIYYNWAQGCPNFSYHDPDMEVRTAWRGHTSVVSGSWVHLRKPKTRGAQTKAWGPNVAGLALKFKPTWHDQTWSSN